MDSSLIVDWSREALRLAMLLGGPLLAVALVTGLIVGIGQTLTQLHEPVIALVPRMIAVLVAVHVLLAWFISRWTGFTASLIDAIPSLIVGT
jgi:flagellar biosynthetic protein FliQ